MYKLCGRKDAGIWRTFGWVPVPLFFVSLSLSPNSLSDLIPPCLPSAPKALTTSLLLLPPIPSPTPPTPSLLVFSGGTAFNCVVEELKSFTTRVAHVLRVSDDGGSTTEIFHESVSGFERLSGLTVLKNWNSSVTHIIASTDENGACRRTLKV
ncbi:hypothetical protein DVH24_007497 [Malus domestica]|uniref:BRCT domain-containing protein n=1 Tax=Malus domestica TaxID=3750 RepID=A0A498HM44_MALDO|nr:hypothetical protein DVH24_007497 [Malus domestica]